MNVPLHNISLLESREWNRPRMGWFISFVQGTIYRNAQFRYRHILYCSLWEECKQTQCPHRSWRERTKALTWYYSPSKNKLIYQVRANTNDFWLSGQYGKYNSNIFLFHPLGPFSSKMMRNTDLTHEIWRFLVYVFLDFV